MVTISINNIDRTELVKFGSLNISDQINSGADIASFIIQKYGDRTFAPAINQDVIIQIDGVTTFGGVIVEVEQSLDGHAIIEYQIRCRDYAHHLDRLLVIERYEDTTLQAVILDLIDRYADDYGFTGNAVQGANVAIKSVSFNEIKISDCLNKLARLTGYYWYVDSAKDIHFFKKNDELAPFNLSDDSNNFIYESLVVRDDFSQVRNRVKVTGGEAIAESRTEKLAGDGERDTFPLGHKFAEKPTVTVAGVAKTVGTDFIQKDEDFDIMWSYGQKYLRFTAGNIPAKPVAPATTNIDVTGLPLKPIVIKRSDSSSISKYGVYEHAIKNDSLKTRDEALQFALADLQSYSDKIRGGFFETYEAGLKSGQTITIAIEARDIAEQFLIQSVKFKQLTPSNYVWQIEIATVKTISIIDALQKILLQERISLGEDETLLNFFSFTDPFSVTDSLGSITATETENYVIEQNDPDIDSYPNPAIINKCTISA